MKIDVEHTLQRRAEAILEMKFRALARAGRTIAMAYRTSAPEIRL